MIEVTFATFPWCESRTPNSHSFSSVMTLISKIYAAKEKRTENDEKFSFLCIAKNFAHEHILFLC